MRKQWPELILASLAVVALGTGLAATRSLVLTPDSMRYALVSQQLCQGRGLRDPVSNMGDTIDASGTVAFTCQPPLLPIALAGMGGVTTGRFWPARVVNVAAFVVVCVFCFLIARRIGGNLAGFLAGAAVAVSPPLLWVIGRMWSEALFIAFFVASVGLLQASRHARPRWLYLLGSGAAAAGATATRYTGVALFPLFLWEAIVTWKRGGDRRAMIEIVLGVSPLLICLALLWTRNTFLTGNLWGITSSAAQPEEGGKALIETLRGMIAVTSGLFGVQLIGAKTVLKEAAFCAVTFGVTAAVCLAYWRYRSANRPLLVERGVDIVIAAAISYLGLLTYALWTQPLVIEKRFATPLAPFIVIAGSVIVAQAWRNIRGTRSRYWAHLAMAIFLGLIVLYSGLHSVEWYWQWKAPPEVLTESQAFQWLKEEVKPGSIIATNRPYRLSFFGGYPSLRLPCRTYNPWARIPEGMEKTLPNEMSRIGAEYLVLFETGKPMVDEQWGRFVGALYRREMIGDRLIITWDCPDGVVYRLVE